MSFWARYVSNTIKSFSTSHVLPGLISFRKSNRFPAAERLQSIEIARKYPVLAAWASLRIVQFPLAGRRFHLKALGRGQSCTNQLYYSRLRRWYTPSIRPVLYLRSIHPITSKVPMYHTPSIHSIIHPAHTLHSNLYFTSWRCNSPSERGTRKQTTH